MITKEEYDISLNKLIEKERLNLLSIENGKKFLDTYKENLEKAKQENKRIFLLFYMKDCDGCKVVKYLIENDKLVQNYLTKYIVLTCEMSDKRISLSQKYNLYSFPAYFIIDANEKIIKQKIGINVNGDVSRNLISWLQK
jgi:thioredoxin-related protein